MFATICLQVFFYCFCECEKQEEVAVKLLSKNFPIRIISNSLRQIEFFFLFLRKTFAFPFIKKLFTWKQSEFERWSYLLFVSISLLLFLLLLLLLSNDNKTLLLIVENKENSKVKKLIEDFHNLWALQSGQSVVRPEMPGNGFSSILIIPFESLTPWKLNRNTFFIGIQNQWLKSSSFSVHSQTICVCVFTKLWDFWFPAVSIFIAVFLIQFILLNCYLKSY